MPPPHGHGPLALTYCMESFLGLGAAIYLDESFNESHDTGGFESLTAFLAGGMIVLLLIALCIIAAIVGIVRRVL